MCLDDVKINGESKKTGMITYKNRLAIIIKALVYSLVVKTIRVFKPSKASLTNDLDI